MSIRSEAMSFFAHVLLFLLFLQRGSSDQNEAASSSSPVGCPSPCFCNVLSRIVYCSRRGLTAIPSAIPADSLELNLNVNAFESGHLRRSNLSRHARLRHLYMSDCGLTNVDADAFADLARLKWLDLSNNRIRTVDPFVFSGLDLDHLFLNGNRELAGLGIMSFAGLRTAGLYLHDCALTDLAPAVLGPINATLRSLSLNGNRLTVLDRSFAGIFASLTHLRLDGNPLRCNCELAWLRAMYEGVGRDGGLRGGPGTPSCGSPERLRGRSVDRIPTAEFRCQTPSFADIELSFGPTETRLRCSATGDPVPVLYWIQPTGQATRYVASRAVVTVEGGGQQRNQGLLTVRANDGNQTRRGMYICVANNDAGNATLSVNVTWNGYSGSGRNGSRPEENGQLVRDDPEDEDAEDGKYGKTMSLDTDLSTLFNSTLDPPPPPSPQLPSELEEPADGRTFTLGDIVGAVAGTHIFTLLVVFAAAHRCCGRKVRPKSAQEKDPRPVTGFMEPPGEKNFRSPVSLVQPHPFPSSIHLYPRNDHSFHRCAQL